MSRQGSCLSFILGAIEIAQPKKKPPDSSTGCQSRCEDTGMVQSVPGKQTAVARTSARFRCRSRSQHSVAREQLRWDGGKPRLPPRPTKQRANAEGKGENKEHFTPLEPNNGTRANSISAETANSSWATFLREEYNRPLLPAHWEITHTRKKKKCLASFPNANSVPRSQPRLAETQRHASKHHAWMFIHAHLGA